MALIKSLADARLTPLGEKTVAVVGDRLGDNAARIGRAAASEMVQERVRGWEAGVGGWNSGIPNPRGNWLRPRDGHPKVATDESVGTDLSEYFPSHTSQGQQDRSLSTEVGGQLPGGGGTLRSVYKKNV